MPVRVAAQVGDVGARFRVPGGRRRLCSVMRAAVVRTLADRGVTDAELSVTLLDDAGIEDLHRRHLGRDGATDVLAFALYENGEAVVGDIYVGIDQARRQAAALSVPLDEEAVRLAVHGTLHVLGMDHPAGEKRVSSSMWRLQERIVDAWRAGK